MTDDLVTLATFEFAPQAEVARLALEQEGIPAFMLDSHLVTTNWFLGTAVGHVKLQVPRSQVEAALAILEGQPKVYGQLGGGSATEENDDVTRCLSCGVKLPDDSDCCPSCGWSYEESDGEEME